MTTDETQRDRRPLYKPGELVRVLKDGPSWAVGDLACVRSVDAWQTVGGALLHYIYDVRFLNLVRMKFDETDLAPAPEGARWYDGEGK